MTPEQVETTFRSVFASVTKSDTILGTLLETHNHVFLYLTNSQCFLQDKTPVVKGSYVLVAPTTEGWTQLILPSDVDLTDIFESASEHAKEISVEDRIEVIFLVPTLFKKCDD